MVTKYQKFGDGYKAEAVKLYREGYSFILLPGCFPTVTLVTGLEKFYPHFHSPR